ncbi:MAG: hypothetical protein AAFQ98_06150 [Bacteroidota bacterium]
MMSTDIFLFEGKHFVRSPFKVVALLLFVLAGVYGLHHGASLYHKQTAEIEKIKGQVEEDRQEYMANYDMDPPSPRSSSPILAIWFNYIYHFKEPSSAMVYSIGQAEQYGFYKRVSLRASPYDADMTQEIANPERLQVGTLDYAFVLIFLGPLLLLLLLYNLKSFEFEQGFLPLIQIQSTSARRWLLSRIFFYFSLVFGTNLLLVLYGGVLTGVFANEASALGQMILFLAGYLLLWTLLFSIILWVGKTILVHALSMVGVWLLLTFVIPAAVNQGISISQPANLMTDLIEVRDQREEVYERPDSVILGQLYSLFPDLSQTSLSGKEEEIGLAKNPGAYALVNDLMKTGVEPIIEDSKRKNRMVRGSYGFNPVTFFQNQLNALAKTHYKDYQTYREEIQVMIDNQLHYTIFETWNQVEVDKERYNEYYEILKPE